MLIISIFYAIFHLFEIIRFFYFWCFPIYNVYMLNIAKAIKKRSFNEVRDFIFQNFLSKSENSYCSMKHVKKRFIVTCKQINRKVPDPHNGEEHYQPFIRKKNTKISETIQNIYLSTKIVWKHLSIVDIKSVITKHPKR